MSLNDLIDAQVKSPSCKVFFNGNRARDIVSIELNSSINDQLSQATIQVLSIGSIKPENRVQIQQGYDGTDRLTFTGVVDSIQYDEYEQLYTVTARDVLKKALDTFLVQEVAFGIDQSTGHYFYSTYTSLDGGTFHIHEYTNSSDLYSNHPETVGNIDNQGAKAEAVVQWLLHMSGLAEGREIQVDDTNFYIGDISPARFHLESVYDSCQRIAQLIGWRVYADPTGVARFRRRPRSPGGYTKWTYTDKASPHNIHKISRTDTNTDLRTYVEVRGASGITYTTRGTSPYLGNTPYRGVLVSSELIDTQGIAQFFGDRILNDLNRLKTTVTLEADGNPMLTPASTVFVNSNVAVGNYLVEETQSSMSAENGYKTVLTCTTYPGSIDSEPSTSGGGIVADFTPIQVVSFGDPKLVVTFDGSSSYSDQGNIVQWAWDWPDGSSTVEADPVASFAFNQAYIDNGQHQNVTLTVTDSLGATATTTSGITYQNLIAGLSVLYRQLYAALTTQAAGSLDGGALWTTQPIPAISVGASNFVNGGQFTASGYAIFGISNIGEAGGIYRTDDCLGTVTKVLTTGFSPSDAITAVHVAELDANYALAGAKDGRVWSSTDAGVTWLQRTSLSTEVREIRHAYTNYDYILAVCSGVGNVYESFNHGNSWTRLSAVSDLDVNRESSGSATNYYGHQSGVRGVQGGTTTNFTFSGGGSVGVPALTVRVDDDGGVMIVDDNGQHWNAASGLFNPTQNNPSNKTHHMIRDGEVPQVVYYATVSGVYKSLDNNNTIQVLYSPIGSQPVGGWGKQVAYGPLAPFPIPAKLIFRGRMVLPDSSQPGYGFYAASGTGWVPIVNNALIQNAELGVTAGYIVWGYDDDYLHMLKLMPSGQPVAYTNYMPLASPAGQVRAVWISRKIGLASGVLPNVYVALETNNYFNFQKYPDFFTNPDTTAITVLTPGSGNVNRRSWQRVMAYNQDKAILALHNHIGDTSDEWVTYNGEGSSISIDRDIGTPDSLGSVSRAFDVLRWAAFPGATPNWFMYQQFDNSLKWSVLMTQGGAIFSIPNLCGSQAITFPSASPLIDPPIYVWDSDLRRGGVYAAYTEQYRQDPENRQFTAPGIYFFEGYGIGQGTLLLTPPANYDIAHMSVTHDREETQDYIAVLFLRSTGTGPDALTRFSSDGGFTWQNGPDIDLPGGGSTPAEIYYVPSLDSTANSS